MKTLPLLVLTLLALAAASHPSVAQVSDESPENATDETPDTTESGPRPAEEEGEATTHVANDTAEPAQSPTSTQVEPREEADAEKDTANETPDGREEANRPAEVDASPEAKADENKQEDDEDEHTFRVSRHPEEPESADVVYNASAAFVRVDAPALEAALETRFDALLEFVDADGNGAYDLGERVVLRYALADLPSEILTTADGRSVRYALPENGTLELRFHALPDGETKYDVVVRSFPFARGDSRLAFGASASAMGGVRAARVNGEPAVVGVRGDNVGYLSWTTAVDVDGTLATVGWSIHTSTSETTESAILYWSYPRGANITHDPTLGVIAALRETLGDASAFYAGGIATIALLALGFALRRRGAP